MAWLEKSCKESGVPLHISDPTLIANAAEILKPHRGNEKTPATGVTGVNSDSKRPVATTESFYV